MDKTLEIIIAVVVLMATAIVILFMLQSESDSFTGFLEDRSSGAECDLLQSQYENGDESVIDDAPEACETGDWEAPG
jgi:uncharacterized protein YxeA